MKAHREYDVALSFAGEDRAYVEMLAEQLKARGITVFYDRYDRPTCGEGICTFTCLTPTRTRRSA